MDHSNNGSNAYTYIVRDEQYGFNNQHQSDDISYIETEYYVNESKRGSFIVNRYHNLCGQPGFCDNDIHEFCVITPVYNCESCHIELAVIFIFSVMCLALAILVGNILIILVGCRRRKSGKSDHMNIWKISLALADLLTGKRSVFAIFFSGLKHRLIINRERERERKKDLINCDNKLCGALQSRVAEAVEAANFRGSES